MKRGIPTQGQTRAEEDTAVSKLRRPEAPEAGEGVEWVPPCSPASTWALFLQPPQLGGGRLLLFPWPRQGALPRQPQEADTPGTQFFVV